ncbi:class I SAM-dependent methyltransferase [Planococcus lenghuensis]|uniref:Methyltransferase type 11 domain-containing protein n=1 Tax=Planococcus lenghuensis TaxID=2213202 RepID=A0A1Q2L3N3_9BACL|nr:class I SAM-dependent methyltransferase [Planococcus lenghuensis]AQQ54667.1 hypothetical protein B0X71_17190 [Planococcus lenghuensis]
MIQKRMDPARAHVLLSEERKALLPPDTVIDQLAIRPTDRVLELGAGNGYFTIPLAKRMPEVVTAVDIQPEMIALLKRQAEKEGLDNIAYVESSLEEIPLGANTADKILAAFSIHEADDLNRAVREAKRILKPAGQLLIIEWESVMTQNGPPFLGKIPIEEIVPVLQLNGFDVKVTRLNPVHYAIHAVPAEEGILHQKLCRETFRSTERDCLGNFG